MSTIQDIVTDTKSEKSTRAKNTLVNFVKVINNELKKYFDKELKTPFGVSKKEKSLTTHILRHIKEHNLRPAKRLRGSLANYSYKLFNGSSKNAAVRAAMCVELVHTALLMHDDFMDQDDKRRGLPTTHEYYKSYHSQKGFRFDGAHYGNTLAINAGDVALCLGYEILSKTVAPSEQVNKAMARLLRGIANTAYGQAYDATLESMGNASEQDIIDLHRAKTAIYTYENPLHIGAILAGAKDVDLELLTEYAVPAGIAFQLQDDILGLFGDPEKTGKPAHSDLRQGKMTLLIIKALEFANKGQRKDLQDVWGKRIIRDIDARIARKIVKETGSLEYSKNTAVKWAKKAQEAIPKMNRRKWNSESVDYLDGIAQYMVERDV